MVERQLPKLNTRVRFPLHLWRDFFIDELKRDRLSLKQIKSKYNIKKGDVEKPT